MTDFSNAPLAIGCTGTAPTSDAWSAGLNSCYNSTMKGKPKVVHALNEALAEELTAISQYFIHAEMCENWHYGKLGDYIRKQSIDEMKHAESLIERILFLDGVPKMNVPMRLNIGQTVKEQLEGDLKLEVNAVAMYNRFVATSRDEGDNASRELFERLLKDEEAHVDWLEAQLHQIKEIGYEQYLSNQVGDEDE
jgi:bacterioferritin